VENQYCGGDGKSIPLEESPKAVQQALAFIKKRASLALGGKEPDLNEVLSAAYLDEQKMTFHSDAEKGLGPVVSALSLGSSAIMQFRPVISKKNKSEAKFKKRVVLTLELRHVRKITGRVILDAERVPSQGDVIVMESNNVQKFYQSVHPSFVDTS
jgi:hypothetical protein